GPRSLPQHSRVIRAVLECIECFLVIPDRLREVLADGLDVPRVASGQTAIQAAPFSGSAAFVNSDPQQLEQPTASGIAKPAQKLLPEEKSDQLIGSVALLADLPVEEQERADDHQHRGGGGPQHPPHFSRKLRVT